MSRKIQTISEKENKLLATIAATKKKLDVLQQKQKNDIGSLACKHGLSAFSLAALDKAFKKLAEDLSNAVK